MIVYIAGKMAGLPDNGRENFNRAEEKLKAQGHIVLNPASLPDGMPRERYMPICLAMLQAADAIYMLNDWGVSKGANLEFDYANYQMKKILFEEDEEEEIPWDLKWLSSLGNASGS